MKPIYDQLGEQYLTGRRTDPSIALQLHKFLASAKSVVNVGAGTGNYELERLNLVAVEPSGRMIQQRAKEACGVVQAFAEQLPFKKASFSHSMTVLSMHHWFDRNAAFEEIKRVTSHRFIALTWDPDSTPYWLTQDYFPEIHEIDRAIFPTRSELTAAFPGMRYYPVPIPAACEDGFTAAYWKRPHAYLDSSVRRAMSTFNKIRCLKEGVAKLQADLKSGEWEQRNPSLGSLDSLDVGYMLAVWDA